MKYALQILAEARIRLVSGLKKYFHGKRGEGLLSARGIQVLEFMCNIQIDNADEPLFMWSLTERHPLPPPLLPLKHSALTMVLCYLD